MIGNVCRFARIEADSLGENDNYEVCDKYIAVYYDNQIQQDNNFHEACSLQYDQEEMDKVGAPF